MKKDNFFKTLMSHQELIWTLVQREFSGRYRGSFGGVLWSFAQPLFMLLVYTTAFGVILKARWGLSSNTIDYAFMLFAGLIIFNAFSECLSKAPTLITNNPNFVKKTVFPLELLSWVMALTALAHAMIGLMVWLSGYMFLFGIPKLTVIFCPVILAAFSPILLGIGWLLSAIGIIIRDINELTAMLSHILLFLTPIFYSIDSAPPALQNFLSLNPLTFIIEQLRLVLFLGKQPNLVGLIIYFLLSCLFAWFSLLIFRRLRPSFADLV